MKLEDIYIRDPFILVEDNKFYMYGTTDEQTWGGKARGFYCYSSDDLVDFTRHEVFVPPKDFWADENFWAPEAYKYNGKYYILASFKKDGVRRGCQFLVADSPTGKFVPLTDGVITDKELECLDGSLFVDNGIPYMVFCNEWTQVKDGKICATQLSYDLKQRVGETKELFRASDASWAVDMDEYGNKVTDGCFIKKVYNIYYMLWSSIGEKGYALGYAISQTGIMGEWTQVDEPIFVENGGHGMLFDHLGKTYLTIHVPNQPHMQERAKIYNIEISNEKITLIKEGL